ncbi:MAG: acyltransferase [Bacteroidetes bacterium GWE2_29_8]|nr:MAG: acyltransferase [Bacteroidetes bacterium GWE2_29_8]OFY23391.1 MAG: acyltransferase [Bacteroidetes bacterium GWF2_29_10]
MKFICKFILSIFGWKVKPFSFKELNKFIIISAPHTSNWDFIIGRIALSVYQVKAKFMIKKELFFFPLNLILKWLGAIPVDRKNAINVVDQVVDIYNKQESFVIIITPEGTRKLVKSWKKGFYQIAIKAQIPIVLNCIDYGKKEIGFETIFYPTGDFEKDIQTIQNYYKGKIARYPENYNLTNKN